MTQIPIAPELLEFVQIITVSHHHTDHLDPDTLQALVRANPKTVLIGPAAHAALVQERSGLPQNQIHLLDAGASWEMNGVQFHAVPAAHETVEKDEQGRCKFLGFVAQFGKWSVYHSGDTVYYEGMLEWLAEWKIDVAILPINGRAPERGVAGNLWGCEAAKLASDIGARLAIPCHYDMFTFNTVSTDDFRDAAMKLKQPFRILQCGEHWCSKSLV